LSNLLTRIRVLRVYALCFDEVLYTPLYSMQFVWTTQFDYNNCLTNYTSSSKETLKLNVMVIYSLDYFVLVSKIQRYEPIEQIMFK